MGTRGPHAELTNMKKKEGTDGKKVAEERKSQGSSRPNTRSRNRGKAVKKRRVSGKQAFAKD